MIKNDIQTNTSLQSYSKASDLPVSFRYYTLQMSSKGTYSISGEEVRQIMEADTNFVQLKSGHIINKAFIVEMVWDKHETIRKYREIQHGK